MDMKNADGQTFFSGEVGATKSDIETDEQSIKFLEDLRIIEEHLDVRFKCPEDVFENDLRDAEQIKNLLLDGYLLLKKEFFVRTATTMISNKMELNKLLDQSKKENSFFLICRDYFEGNLIGKRFPIGKFYVFTGPYSVNVQELQHKVDTFAEGDARKIVFECTSATKTVIYKDPKITDTVLELSGSFPEKPILINDMKLNLGFIYENHKKL